MRSPQTQREMGTFKWMYKRQKRQKTWYEMVMTSEEEKKLCVINSLNVFLTALLLGIDAMTTATLMKENI